MRSGGEGAAGCWGPRAMGPLGKAQGKGAVREESRAALGCRRKLTGPSVPRVWRLGPRPTATQCASPQPPSLEGDSGGLCPCVGLGELPCFLPRSPGR